MNIEGFRRFVAGEFAHFLAYARASLEETSRRIQDGIDRGYFSGEACKVGFDLADQSARLTTALQTSLRGFAQARKPARPTRKPHKAERDIEPDS